MIKADIYYQKNLTDILNQRNTDVNPRAVYKDGVKAHTYYVTQIFEKYNLAENEYPLTTLRNTAIKTGIREILWIYQKQSNCLKLAKEMGIHWWNEWDIGDGTIGNRYGYTVNKYSLMDNLLEGLEKNPFGRRHIMNLYQEEDMNSSDGLHPCAFETQYSVRKNSKGELYLDLTLTQRSNDYIMAGYINKIQYVGLQHMICGHLRHKGMDIHVGYFSHFVQNLHIYDRHIEAAKEILSRKCETNQGLIGIMTDKNFYEYTIEDFEIFQPKVEKINSPIEIAI